MDGHCIPWCLPNRRTEGKFGCGHPEPQRLLGPEPARRVSDMRFAHNLSTAVARLLSARGAACEVRADRAPTSEEMLRKVLLVDADLSTAAGLSCAVSHSPETGGDSSETARFPAEFTKECCISGSATLSFRLQYMRRSVQYFTGTRGEILWRQLLRSSSRPRNTRKRRGGSGAWPILHPLEQNNSSPLEVCQKNSRFRLRRTARRFKLLRPTPSVLRA